MFSRVNSLSSLKRQTFFTCARYAQSTSIAPQSNLLPPARDDYPERDLVNFPRPVRQEYPGKVRLGFIPEEWFQFFYKKTGVTGPYAFGTGVITYLCSKEIYVMEHEFYNGLSLLAIILIAVKYLGPKLAAFADREIEKEENYFKEARNSGLKSYEDSIEGEKKSQWCADGETMLVEAKRENVLLQLEAVFRERQMMVFQEVKRRLEFQLEKQNVDRRISQKHMVNWVVQNVVRSITPDQEKQALRKCIADLKALAPQ